MARPKEPLIDRGGVVVRALEMIDEDGLEAFSIRGLAQSVGVNAASLYHHFVDKAAILRLVCLYVMREGGVGEPAQPGQTWQDYVRRVANGYRDGLLRHPNVAPLMAPTVLLRPFSLSHRERVAEKLQNSGILDRHIHPILDSIEILCYGSALLNPKRQSAGDRLPIGPDDDVPVLARAVRAAPRKADEIFSVQLEALIEGWTALVTSRNMGGRQP